MLSTVMSVWQQAPDGWSFAAAILASALLVLAAKGPAYIAALSARAIGLREQDRLDLLARLEIAAANDVAPMEPPESSVLRFPSMSRPRPIADEDEQQAA